MMFIELLEEIKDAIIERKVKNLIL
jgi:hypothetical protein